MTFRLIGLKIGQENTLKRNKIGFLFLNPFYHLLFATKLRLNSCHLDHFEAIQGK